MIQNSFFDKFVAIIKVAEWHLVDNPIRIIQCLSRCQITLGTICIICNITALPLVNDKTPSSYLGQLWAEIEEDQAFPGTKRFQLENIEKRFMELEGECILTPKLRALTGCISSLLFVVAGTFGLITSRKNLQNQKTISIIFSITAVLFCFIFFLPTFILVVFDYSNRMKWIYSELEDFYTAYKSEESHGYNESLYNVRFVGEYIMGLYIFQIIIGVLQAFLALNCTLQLCLPWFRNRNNEIENGSLENINIHNGSASSNTTAVSESETDSSLDLPPKYEDLLSLDKLTPNSNPDSRQNEVVTTAAGTNHATPMTQDPENYV